LRLLPDDDPGPGYDPSGDDDDDDPGGDYGGGINATAGAYHLLTIVRFS
jgi:hypothetical protein